MTDIRDMGAMALTLAVTGIIISFTLLVMSEMDTEITATAGADSYAENASDDAMAGVAEFSGWFTIVALALVFSVILGIIVRYVAGAGSSSSHT